MRHLLPIAIAAVLTACASDPAAPVVAAGPGGPNAVVAYTQVSLGSLGGPHSIAVDINASGEVAGNSTTSNGESHGFRWTKAGGMVDLTPLPGDRQSTAVAINDDGSILGYSGEGRVRVVLWLRSGARAIVPIPGVPTEPVRVNDYRRGPFPNDFNKHGEIVGWEIRDFKPEPFAWSPSGGKFLDLFALPALIGGDGGMAELINDKGEICTMQANLQMPNTNSNVWRSYFWSRSREFVAVGDPFGASVRNLQIICKGLNNHGVMAGILNTVVSHVSVALPFRWSRNAGTVVLPVGDFETGHAENINDHGVVVGRVATRPALWTASNELRVLGLDGYATALNDKGVVVGVSGNVAAMWTPAK